MKRFHGLKAPGTLVLALALALTLLLGVGCSPDTETESSEATETDPATSTPEPEPEPLEPAEYELVFDAAWSETTHPTDFPGNPHFSGLIGAVHGPDATVWEDGGMATPGVKNMAETGGKDPLDAEIEGLVADGTACELISGDGVNPAPGTASVTFTATEECPLVSVVTMIAPSPDWFVGVDSLDLRQDGEWADEIVVELTPWDAGTDSGTSYASGNDPTSPAETIFLMPAGPPIDVDGEIPPFGTFTFTKVGG